MENLGLIIIGIGIGCILWLFISAAFLLLGARIAKIEGRSYGKALATMFLSIMGSLLLGFVLTKAPVWVGLIGGFVGGFVITALIMMSFFSTTFGRAISAAVLGWLFSSVLIAIPAMAAAILVPAVNKALSSASMVQTVSNGKNIYTAFFASQMDASVLNKDAKLWPRKGQYASSTDFFIDLVESGRMTVSYDFFAASGVPAAKSNDPQDFKPENNAWRVVLGLEDAPEGTPFMFTRNYNPESLQDGDEPIVLNDEPPFGKEGMVVILKGGAAYSLKGNQLRNSYFNPAGTVSTPNMSIVGP